MSAAEAIALKEQAQRVERRGDVVLQVSQSAWRGYFQRQTFINALFETGAMFPTIVVGPDNWVYDGGTLRILLAQDPEYSGPGLLLVFVERVDAEQCRVAQVTFLGGRR